MINEEFIATLDYLVATCLWPSIVDARSQSTYYGQRVSFYKLHDGREGRRNWRSELRECLTAWQLEFPEVVRRRKSGIDGSLVPEPSAEPGGGEPVPDEWMI